MEETFKVASTLNSGIIVIVAVVLAAVMKEGKIVFINANNEAAIPFQFGYADKCSMWKFGYVFHNVYCA